MFSCLPHNNRCEWCNLVGFVDQYSEIHKKKYRPVEFPELTNRNSKEPEVILEAEGDKTRVVIERKSIVQQSRDRYMADHRNEQLLLPCFLRQLKSLGCYYSDALYRLEINERDLSGKRKREITGIAERLAQDVSLNWSNAKSRSGIAGKEPIPWRFRALSPGEIDFDAPESGIGMMTYMRSELSSPEKIEGEKLGYINELEHQAVEAADKFDRYADCRKVFLVQFFGDTLDGVDDEEIVEIIKSARLPEAIDEVWVAREEWVGLDESEIQWERVR